MRLCVIIGASATVRAGITPFTTSSDASLLTGSCTTSVIPVASASVTPYVTGGTVSRMSSRVTMFGIPSTKTGSTISVIRPVNSASLLHQI